MNREVIIGTTNTFSDATVWYRLRDGLGSYRFWPTYWRLVSNHLLIAPATASEVSRRFNVDGYRVTPKQVWEVLKAMRRVGAVTCSTNAEGNVVWALVEGR